MHRTLLNTLTISLTALIGVVLLYLLLAVFQEPQRLAAQEVNEVSIVDGTIQQLAQADFHHGDDDDDDDDDENENQLVNIPEHGLLFSATIGLDAHQCATESAVAVTAGTDIVACFKITNLGSRTYISHTLRDELWGLGGTYTDIVLTPVDGILASFFVIGGANVAAESLVNTLSWATLDDQGRRVLLTDTIEVLVPQIQLTHTVGVEAETCALTNTINVMPGTLVTHCYQVTNVSEFPLVLHNASDSEIGALLKDVPYPLEVGSTYTHFSARAATTTSSNVVSWTATTANGLHAMASAAAQINVPQIQVSTTVGTEAGICAPTTSITVTVGETVTYCYLIQNLSSIEYHPLVFSDTLPGGSFPLTDTLSGNKLLFFTFPVSVTETLTNVVTWTVQTPEGLMATDIATAQVNALSRLDVVAFYDVDRDGEYHSLEEPVPAVTITLQSSHQSTQTAMTNEQGIGSFVELPLGEYRLSIPSLLLEAPYTVNAADMPKLLIVDEVAQHHSTLSLFKGDEADCDGDGVPDYTEGLTDINEDGNADYCDPTLLNLFKYLPIVRN